MKIIVVDWSGISRQNAQTGWTRFVIEKHMFDLRIGIAVLSLVATAACSSSKPAEVTRQSALPVTQWDHRPEARTWTRSTMAAVNNQGAALIETVPSDIDTFCPGYADASDQQRAQFWTGLLSALAKHESTWRPEASGGGGAWIGLTQIDPRTARGYDCNAQTVAELKNGSANLSCAVRIAAHQVSRDDALVSEDGSWRGMARDWAPFRDPSKRAEMATWTSRQSYCR